jgi:hypothetical protein
MVLTFTWDTTEINKGDYIVSAKASLVPSETDTTDNTKVADSMVTVLSPEQDVAIKDVTTFKTVVGQGYTLSISVTAKNYGIFTETFNVTVCYSQTAIILSDGKNYATATLTSGDSATLAFTWNTTGVAKGNYTISANATILPDEADTIDNAFTDGTVLITFPGDVNGDGKVRVDDILAIALAFGSDLGDLDYDPNVDVNGDGKVRVDDILIAALKFGLG